MKLKNYMIKSLAMGFLIVPVFPINGMQFVPISVVEATQLTETADSITPIVVSKGSYSLKLDTKSYTTKTMQVNGEDISFRAYENRVYVKHPADADYEKMNIYIPEAYFENQTINGYTAKTAPIFMPNEVGGYMSGEAGEPSEESRHGGPNAALIALSKGYVVAAPAVRGRTLQAADGSYTGKAPALIVDYKAAVRYLRYNKKTLPAGDTEKIISNGTSAGGALSALLGATGNSKDYEPYLKEIGAADERDDIFASSDYCPITNLEHADMAYEWVFNGVNDYHQHKMEPMPAFGKKPGALVKQEEKAIGDLKMNRPDNAPIEITESVKMSDLQIQVSEELKRLFPAYVNHLALKDKDGNPLTLDENGNGSFKTYLESFYIASAQRALDKGEDLSGLSWLKIENGKVVGMDLSEYAIYATRMKGTPAFDTLDNSSPENNEFGTKTINSQHFTDFSMKNSTASATLADMNVIKLMNPMNYINNGTAKTAKYWRIRHGAIDRDTSLAIPVILATKLINTGSEVDFASPWNRGHDGDYDLTELFVWMDEICKAK
jgi:hypothetical protein